MSRKPTNELKSLWYSLNRKRILQAAKEKYYKEHQEAIDRRLEAKGLVRLKDKLTQLQFYRKWKKDLEETLENDNPNWIKRAKQLMLQEITDTITKLENA